MGTRGLTIAILGGTHRIAQYGQWDHYPSGQGCTVRDFCAWLMKAPANLSQFASALAATRWLTDGDVAIAHANAGIAPEQEWLNGDQAARMKNELPYCDRDIGAGILEMVATGVHLGSPLKDSLSFAGDSLFCEWAYVVDLDAMTLEVYKGFNRKKLVSERFANVPGLERASGYEPVRLLRKWKLDDLPSEETFLKIEDEGHERDEAEEGGA